MRRLLELGLLCAALLAWSPGLARAAEPASEEAVVMEEGSEEERGKPLRAGYADSTGNLESLEEMEGLRVTLRSSGTLRAKRGYTPLEVTLHNTGDVPRLVRLGFQGYGSGSPNAAREVELAPRQRLTTHLLIPAPVQSGAFSVRGPHLRGRTSGVYLDEGSALSVLVLGSSRAFEAATAMPRAEDRTPPEMHVRFLSAQDAPRELAAYVGYPVVMVAEEVASVPADVWAALENYAAAGGSLMLIHPPRDVHQRLPMLSRELKRNAWNDYGFGDVYLCQAGPRACATAMMSADVDGRPPLSPVGPPPRWTRNRSVLNKGEAPLLPNALVPVGRFLIFIFLFSLVVGPGGLMLARRKGPLALLIGVPSVALVTCLIILANSVLVDGFVTHSSRYSYTLLDRPRDRAVTSVVAGYYANLAVDEVGLPAHSALLAPDELHDWLVDVSWTGGGMEAQGFLPARTYVEWGELAVVPTRARLVVRREGGQVKVQNALGAPLQQGYLRLEAKVYALPPLADGAEGVATELEGRFLVEDLGDVMSLPTRLGSRMRELGPDLLRPLEERTFVARLGGSGFGPLAALKVELHEGSHYVRGQVDTP